MKTFRGLARALALSAAAGCSAESHAAGDVLHPKTISARAFVDSIGVNTHFNYGGTVYVSQEPAVVAAIAALHVKHIREGMLYPFERQFPTLQHAVHALSRAGVRTLAGVQTADLNAPDFSIRWAKWFDSVGGRAWVEATEPPNECDLNGCLADVAANQRTLYGTVKAYAPSAGVAVLGPSLTTAAAYARAGDLAAYLDNGNAHLYTLSQPPETTGVCRISDACLGGATVGSGIGNTSSLARFLADAKQVSAARPVVNSEAGYCTTVDALGNTRYNDLPESVQASYWPRYLLYAFGELGIGRTYIYDIADDGLSPPTFDKCGLLDARAVPKPSYRILKYLLDRVDDPGPAYRPRPLNFTLRAQANVDGNPIEAIALGSRTHSYTIAMWNPVSTFYQQSGNGGNPSHALSVEPLAASLTLATSFKAATRTTFDPATGAATTAIVDPAKPISLSLTPTITLVTLRP